MWWSLSLCTFGRSSIPLYLMTFGSFSCKRNLRVYHLSTNLNTLVVPLYFGVEPLTRLKCLYRYKRSFPTPSKHSFKAFKSIDGSIFTEAISNIGFLKRGSFDKKSVILSFFHVKQQGRGFVYTKGHFQLQLNTPLSREG